LTCDGSLYIQPVFSQVDTTLNVFFGVNTTYAGDIDSLYMDVYQPVGDAAIKRPLMILAFGGSFVTGQREDMAPLCHFYAQHGYVTATIDYRLFTGPFFPFPDSVVFGDVVIKAIGDMKAAVRYFRADAAGANQFKIDSQLVIVGGGSAGAIAALHVAYMDSLDQLPLHLQTAVNNNGGFEGNTNTAMAHNSSVQGVINLSGALGNAAWMDAGNAPVFSVHDDGDNIVPYGQGYGTFVNRPISYLEGSQVITDTAIALGIPNRLITIPNSTGHVSYVNDTLWQDSIFTSSLLFLEDIICPTVVTIPTIEAVHPVLVLFPNPASQQFQLQVEGGLKQAQYAVYNGVGQCVATGQLDNQQSTIDCQKWPRGYYRVAVWEKDKPSVLATWKSLIIR
ncbi:MAG: T9SS type A sorting domain-containing protein, partial [Aureispira sp.]